MSTEQILWKGTPSQMLNLPVLLLGLLAAGVLTAAVLLTTFVAGPLVIPLIAVTWIACLFPWLCKVISTRFDNYELTNERLKHASGVFSRTIEVLVDDVRPAEGRGHIGFGRGERRRGG